MNLTQLTIGKRISGSFGVLILFFIISGTISYFGITSIVKNAKAVIEGNRLDSILAQKEVDHLNWVNKVNALLTDEKVTELKIETDDHKCGFGKWLYGEGRKQAEKQVPELAHDLKAIEHPHKKLHSSAITIKNQFRQADISLGMFLREKKVDHLLWTHKVKSAIMNKSNQVNVQMDHTKCSLGKWLNSEKVNVLKQSNPSFSAIISGIYGPHKMLHESSIRIKNFLSNSEYENAQKYYQENTSHQEEKTLSVLNLLLAWHEDQLNGMREATSTYASQTVPALKNVQLLLKKIRETARNNIMSDKVMITSADKTQSSSLTVGVIAVLICIFLSWVTVRSISNILKKVTNDLENSSSQLSEASDAISSSSQNLAQNASEQAATVEETSASLEEMSSMSVATVDLTKGAETLMKQNIEQSGQSLKAIVDITSSISKIENESGQIGQIIHTIDQIAFQTNLLALNAAVEAARAGDAGQGFAVVADEVRNLAQRAAEAAQSTQSLLNATIERVTQISGAVKNMNTNFEGIVESATVIGEKTAAITTASNEQSKGIKQINDATTQIDAVTQQIASSAEESAAAAEQLNAQSNKMSRMVFDLKRLVYGTNSQETGRKIVKQKLPNLKKLSSSSPQGIGSE